MHPQHGSPPPNHPSQNNTASVASTSHRRNQGTPPNRPGHKDTASVAATWRRLVAVFALIATLAGGLTAAGSPQSAQAAAPPDNPKATLHLTKTADGTGHGTSDQTFITRANGFPVGDDSPTDGVVTSNDIVTYAFHLDVSTGVERDVKVALDVPEYLTVRDSSWCTGFGPVSAQLDGNVCSFHIPRGAVFSIERTLTLDAMDTGGEVKDGQVLAADLSKNDSGVFAHVETEPVTVVSAPAADVVWANQISVNKDQSASGTLKLRVKQLKYGGSSNIKGASTNGAWSGTLDVSDFPARTTWSVNGRYAAVTNGTILVSGSGGGDVSVEFIIPGGWPSMGDGTQYLDYDIGLNVDENAFAADGGVLNMGVGYDPGTNQSRDESTSDPQTGASAGVVYANNNWTRVRVVNTTTPKSVFGKTLNRPFGNETMFDASSKSFSEDGAGSVPADNDMRFVDAGTQLTANVYAETKNISDDMQGVSLVLGDTFNAKDIQANSSARQYQRYDPSRGIVVTTPDGTALSQLEYNVQYAVSSAVTTDDVGRQDSTQWRSGIPTTDDLFAVRVVIKPGSWTAGSDGGTYTVAIPTRIITVDARGNEATVADPLANHFVNSVNQLKSVPDRGVGALWRTEGEGADPVPDCTGAIRTTSGACYIQRNVATIAQERIGATVDITSRDKTTGRYDDTLSTYEADGTVDYMVASSATNMWSTRQESAPSITVTLDKCQNVPVNTSGQWDMQVRPGETGANGRICGSADSTPITLVFTPKEGVRPTASSPDKDTGQVTASWPAIMFSAHINPTSPSGEQSAEVTLSVDGGQAGTASDTDSTRVTIEPFKVIMGDLHADDRDVESNDDLGYTASVIGTNKADRVIVLPREGDDSLWGNLDTDDYDGNTRTDYSGDLTLKSVALDVENSTTRGARYYTTKPNPGIDPDSYTASDWHELTAGTDLSTVTALRVVALPDDEYPAEGSVAIATVHITMGTAGNEEPDAYLMWLSRDVSEGEDKRLWPTDIQVVASQFGGHVWWDNDRDGSIDEGETGIQGITVDLYKADDIGSDGKPKAGTISRATTTTDADGHYRFTGLHSDRYVTVMTRDTDRIALTTETHYHQTLCVDQTYSYSGSYGGVGDPDDGCKPGDYGSAPTTTSGTVNILKDKRDNDVLTPDSVDFGWVNPDPKVEVDKSEAVVIDNRDDDGNKDGTSTVSWNVTVKNTGSQAITGGTLTDRTSSDMYDVTAETMMGGLAPNLVGPNIATDTTVSTSIPTYVLTDQSGVAWQIKNGSEVSRVTPASGQSLDGVSFTPNLVSSGMSNYYGHSFVMTDQSGVAWRVTGLGTASKVQGLDGVSFAPGLISSSMHTSNSFALIMTDRSGVAWFIPSSGAASRVTPASGESMDSVRFAPNLVGPKMTSSTSSIVMTDQSGVAWRITGEGGASRVTPASGQ